MASSGGIWAPIAMRAFKHAFKKTTKLIQARLANISRPLEKELSPVLVRSTPRQPIHPIARLRQSQGRWYTTHSTINAAVRRFMSTGRTHAAKYNKAAFPTSSTATAVSRLTSRAPFASTLRPNLTGGALPRTAGGYSMGGGRAGGARYFSHTPAAPAQVVNNVSMAVRAFWLSGQKAQFDGVSPMGEKKYRTVSDIQEKAGRKMRSISKTAPGSFIDFHVNPTVTALSPLSAAFPFASSTMEQSAPTLNTEGFLDVLSTDFSRALKDLAATLNDLKKLSILGDLPITLERKSTLRVRFPGCDIDTVERLCDEVGVQRGIIGQDPDFDISVGGQMALLFPFAPTSENTMSSPGGSSRSLDGFDYEQIDEVVENPWLSGPDGYESMNELSESGSEYFTKPGDQQDCSDFEGLEGIHRFLEQCDGFRRI
ncbi:casein kinase II beta 2 subunit [Phlyctema vagabunda]|uniref:Casein kinase II beta 2 subunit n=1 Tax=Phlyctema vagabunda TaxID=108571 RepID=A0ABR4PBV8_9HELO